MVKFKVDEREATKEDVVSFYLVEDGYGAVILKVKLNNVELVCNNILSIEKDGCLHLREEVTPKLGLQLDKKGSIKLI